MAKQELTQNDLDFMEWALKTTPEGFAEEEVETTPQEQEFTAEAEKLPSPPKELSRARSLIDAPLKGFSRVAGKALGAMPTVGKTFEETIEEAFPTQKGRFAEGALQRGVELASGGGATGLAGLGRSLLGGVLSEGVSKAPFIPEGLKPYLEMGAEIGALSAPGLGKKIVPTAAQQSLVEEARALGLSESEIAPLIQGDKKLDRLSKVAGKRFRTQKALKESKTALDSALESMETHPHIDKVLAPQQAEGTISTIEKKMFDKLNARERGLIREDLQVLKDSPKSAKDFMKFFRDINKSIRTSPDARKSLNLLKDDVIEAVQKISPELGNTFKVTNKLYSNYSKIFDKLRPNFQKDLLQLGRHAIVGMLGGHYPALLEIAGSQAAKNLSREMLINPRFQNLSRQIVQAVNSGRLGIANKLTSELAKLTSKESPKLASEIEKFNWESIEGIGKDEGADERS